MARETKKSTLTCPCGGATYAQCCALYHDGVLPASALLLMRARYSAYALGLLDYVHQTWHVRTRPPRDDLIFDDGTTWIGLDIKRHVDQGEEAIVEFVARYKRIGRAHRLHEVSQFVHEAGRWFYLEGHFPDREQRLKQER